MAETWQKLIQMKQAEGAEKAELHQLWKKMIQLLKDSTQTQDNKTEQSVMFIPPHLDTPICTVQPELKWSVKTPTNLATSCLVNLQ